jgi:hypothetical protein
MTMSALPLGRIIRLALLCLGAIVFLAPKAQSDIFTSSLSLIPEHFTYVENFTKALSRVPMRRLLWNGVVVCGLIFFFQVLVAIPCAHAMAKLRFRAARMMMVLVMLGLLVPIHATALPLYVAFDRASLLNSYAALVAPFTISVFAIFMFLQFFRAMPDDLIHADGKYDLVAGPVPETASLSAEGRFRPQAEQSAAGVGRNSRVGRRSERNESAEETETVLCQSSPIHRHPSCIRQGYTVSLVGFFEMSPVCS